MPLRYDAYLWTWDLSRRLTPWLLMSRNGRRVAASYGRLRGFPRVGKIPRMAPPRLLATRCKHDLTLVHTLAQLFAGFVKGATGGRWASRANYIFMKTLTCKIIWEYFIFCPPPLLSLFSWSRAEHEVRQHKHTHTHTLVRIIEQYSQSTVQRLHLSVRGSFLYSYCWYCLVNDTHVMDKKYWDTAHELNSWHLGSRFSSVSRAPDKVR